VILAKKGDSLTVDQPIVEFVLSPAPALFKVQQLCTRIMGLTRLPKRCGSRCYPRGDR
jgi:hypothetical protein